MFNVPEEEVTGGSLKKSLAFLAIPIVTQQLALSVQQIVDVFWLGRFDSTAVAALGLVAPIIGLFVVTLGAAFGGVQILVSQRVGSGDHASARRITVQSMIVTVFLMAILTLLVNKYALTLTRVFDVPASLAHYGAIYLGTIAIAYVVSSPGEILEAAFIGSGDSFTPFLANLVAIGTNVVLDPFFIFGWEPFPKLGMAGAAYATLIGYAFGGAILFAVALSSRGQFSLTRGALAFRPREILELLRVGAPQAGQNIGRQTARLLMVAIISITGSAAALTAYTVGARIATIVFIPAIGVGQAATTLVGQNLGAERPDRATKATWLSVGVGTVGLGALGVVQWLFPAALAHLFVPGISGKTLTYSVAYLQILAYGYWGIGAIYTASAGFNGAGRTEITMYAVLLQYWTVRIPIAAIMAFVLSYGALGPFWAVTISNVVAGVGLTVWFTYSTSTGMLTRAVNAISEPAD